MGTTRTALRGDDHGGEFGYVLCIEGYQYLLTDHDDPTVAGIGWSATDWTSALPNLEVKGSMSQSLDPWSSELQVQNVTFAILPDDNDTFAIDMFKSKPAIRSELTVGFDSSDHTGGFNMVVKDAGLFSPSAPVYIGNETFNVTGTPAGFNIPIAAEGSGYLAPFGGDAVSDNRFPGPHAVGGASNVGAYGTNSPVYATDSPSSWIGKKVGLWVHRVIGGVWDTKAEAELLFAGTISDVGESGLHTVLSCEGINKQILDATLLQDQWTAKVVEGYTFEDGEFIRARIGKLSTPIEYAAKFVAGTDFTSGRYTAHEFGALLSVFLDADSVVGAAGSAYQLRWSAGESTTDQDRRWIISAQHATAIDASIGMTASSKVLLEFLGFANIDTEWDGRPVKQGPRNDSKNLVLISDHAPLLTPNAISADGEMTLELEDTSGTFVDHTDTLPPDALEYVAVGGSEVWSYYIIDGKVLFFGQRTDSVTIKNITATTGMSTMSNGQLGEALRKSSKARNGVIKQVYFASDTFSNTMARLFASTDGQGNNHATHDVLPWGAGIPWELLGPGFTESLTSLEQSGAEDSIALLIEKPTRLWDAIKSDFALRMAMPVWKDGGIRIAQFTTPNASTSEHTLDETNKSDEKRTSTSFTSEYLAHTLKIEHSRSPLTDKYTDHYIARSETAYQSNGQSGVTKTIKARNSYASVYASGASVEALADMLTARFLPILSKPSRIFTRSIPHTHFHMAPGDTIDFADDFIRNPLTGIREVAARAGIIIGIRWSLGISSGGQDYFGECDILYTEEDRLFPLAPSMEHALAVTSGDYTAGYYAGGKKLLVYQNKFTTAANGDDSDAFAVGDEIRITEMDPADPTAADTQTDVIVSITAEAVAGYDAIELTTGFTPNADTIYLVNYDAYDQVGNDQKLHAFQADDVDGTILDTIEPNLVADEVKLGSSAADILALPSRHSNEQFGDGEPLSASFMRDQIRMANNLANHKTAPHTPIHFSSAEVVSSAAETEYKVLMVFPFLVGDDMWPGGRKRVIKVAPKFHTTSGSGGFAYVRITSSANQPKGDTYTDTTWYGPKHQVTWVDSSTSDTILAVQDLEVVRSEYFDGMTWITVEAGDKTSFSGLGEFWLGPLQ